MKTTVTTEHVFTGTKREKEYPHDTTYYLVTLTVIDIKEGRKIRIELSNSFNSDKYYTPEDLRIMKQLFVDACTKLDEIEKEGK